MASNADNLKDGTFIRFSNGRAVEGRKVFQRVYLPGIAGLAQMLLDSTLPKIGDEYDGSFPQLRVVDADLRVINLDKDGNSVVRVTVDYEDMGDIHISGGSTTASVLTSFDSTGARITVDRNGDEYVAQVEIEEARSFIVVERVLTFAPEFETVAEYVKGIVNTVNDDTFLGDAARCWRIARIEYELMFERVTGTNVVQQVYRMRYYIEHRPAKDIELVAGETFETVAGWDSIVAYEIDGAIPSDAIFSVVQKYAESDFDTVFSGVTF